MDFLELFFAIAVMANDKGVQLSTVNFIVNVPCQLSKWLRTERLNALVKFSSKGNGCFWVIIKGSSCIGRIETLRTNVNKEKVLSGEVVWLSSKADVACECVC